MGSVTRENVKEMRRNVLWELERVVRMASEILS